MGRAGIRPLKIGQGQGDALDGIGGAIVPGDLGGEIQRAAGGTHQRHQLAGLHVVGAVAAIGAEPAAGIGDHIVVPQAAHHIAIHVESHFPVFHGEHLHPKLQAADEDIVGKGVPAKEGLAAAPLIVHFGGLHHAFPGGEHGHICAGISRKGIPLGFVHHHHFGGLGNGEHLQRIVAVQAAFAHIGIHVFILFFLGHVGSDIRHQPHFVHRMGGIGIGSEDIGHSVRTGLAVGRVHQLVGQVVHATLTHRLDDDALLHAHRFVKGQHQLVKDLLLRTVVIVPQGQHLRIIRRELHRFGESA